MNASLNGLGNQLFAWLGPLSIELAALALLVLAAGRLVKSPALRHLLWLAVLVKPLAAVVVSSPYTVLAPLAAFVQPGWDALPAWRVGHPTLTPLAAAPAAIAPSSMPFTLAAWGALLWLVGVALLTGRILLGFGILRRLRRQALVQRDGPLFEALRRARAAFDCPSRVEVATSPSIRSPMVLGILRPLIVVPADLVQRLRGDELTLVLMHELAHVRRCDNLVLLLQRLVTAALFFHPAVWLCGRMLRREAEQACDDLVVGVTARPEAYARGLTLVAEEAAHFNQSAGRIPMMSTLAATEFDLSRRIRRTLDGRARRMGMRTRLLAVVLLSPLAVVTLPSCGTTGEASKAAAKPSPDKSLVAERGTAGTRHADLFLVVDQHGNMTLNQEPVTLETLGEQLQAKQRLLDNPRIVVQHDEQAPVGQFTRVIDTVQQAGLVMLGYPVIATEQGHGVLQRALAADPAAWSEELKAGLLELQPESTIEEIAELARERRRWLHGIPTDPGRSPEDPEGSTSDGTTVIPYEIATTASVELVIHNAAGQPVRTLGLGPQSSGEHRVVWDRLDDRGHELGNGLYFCLFKTDAGERWQKKVWLK